eukprot:360928-Chlamydomonas_euryale.AAC.1
MRPLLVVVLVHRVLAVVVVTELLGVREDGEEDAAHAARAQVLLCDLRRVLRGVTRVCACARGGRGGGAAVQRIVWALGSQRLRCWQEAEL